MPKYQSALSACILVLCALSGSNAHASEEVLLNCDRYDGEQRFQIYINEEDGYVIYNAQVRDGDFERELEYTVVGEENGEKAIIDDGLTIRSNNNAFIQAGSDTSSFVFVKQTAAYEYAWTTLVPTGNDDFLPLGFCQK
jgi:hypothetical protein